MRGAICQAIPVYKCTNPLLVSQQAPKVKVECITATSYQYVIIGPNLRTAGLASEHRLTYTGIIRQAAREEILEKIQVEQEGRNKRKEFMKKKRA